MRLKVGDKVRRLPVSAMGRRVTTEEQRRVYTVTSFSGGLLDLGRNTVVTSDRGETELHYWEKSLVKAILVKRWT